MTTPTIMIKSMMTKVATMMTSRVVAPSLWGVSVGLALLLLLTGMIVAPTLLIESVLLLLLLTGMVVAPTLWVGCVLLLLLLTGMIVAPTLWVGCVLLLLLTAMVVASSGVEAVQAKHTMWHVTQQTELCK